jgi:hypothetical protein
MISEVKVSSEKCKFSNWDEAINDASQRLVEGKLYLARLRSAIKTFAKRKGCGRTLAGDATAGPKIKAATQVFKTLPTQQRM